MCDEEYRFLPKVSSRGACGYETRARRKVGRDWRKDTPSSRLSCPPRLPNVVRMLLSVVGMVSPERCQTRRCALWQVRAFQSPEQRLTLSIVADGHRGWSIGRRGKMLSAMVNDVIHRSRTMGEDETSPPTRPVSRAVQWRVQDDHLTGATTAVRPRHAGIQP